MREDSIAFRWLGFGSASEYGAQWRHRSAWRLALAPSQDYRPLATAGSTRHLKRTLNGVHMTFLGLGERQGGAGCRQAAQCAAAFAATRAGGSAAAAAEPHTPAHAGRHPVVGWALAGLMTGGAVFVTTGHAAAKLAVSSAASKRSPRPLLRPIPSWAPPWVPARPPAPPPPAAVPARLPPACPARTRPQGPAVILSYLVAGLAALLAALCYAEFAVRLPRAGAAHAYVMAALGDMPAGLVAGTTIMQFVVVSSLTRWRGGGGRRRRGAVGDPIQGRRRGGPRGGRVGWPQGQRRGGLPAAVWHRRLPPPPCALGAAPVCGCSRQGGHTRAALLPRWRGTVLGMQPAPRPLPLPSTPPRDRPDQCRPDGIPGALPRQAVQCAARLWHGGSG